MAKEDVTMTDEELHVVFKKRLKGGIRQHLEYYAEGDQDLNQEGFGMTTENWPPVIT